MNVCSPGARSIGHLSSWMMNVDRGALLQLMVFSDRRVALKRKECNRFFCLGAEGVQPCLLGFKSYFVASSGACAR